VSAPTSLLFDDRPLSPALPAQRSSARALLLVVLLFAGTRLLTWSATYYGAFLLFRIEHRLDSPIEQHERRLAEQGAAREGPEYQGFYELFHDLAPLCRFDGVHYRSIIDGGYQYKLPAPDTTDRSALEQNIAFFPLYPLLVRPLTATLSTPGAMILVSHACALAAALLLFTWIRSRINETVAFWTVAFTFCLPPAVYYSYGYAESVTLLVFVAALWLMDRGAFWAAALVCALATAARPTALGLAVVLVATYGCNSADPRPRKQLKAPVLGLIGAGGLAAYALFLWCQFGSPLVYFDNFRAGWVPDRHRADWLAFLTLTPVWEQFKYFRNLIAFVPPIGLVNAANTLMWNMPLNLFLIFLSLAGLRRVPRSFRPLLLLAPLIFLQSYAASGGAKFGLEPIARYMAVAVPALVVLAAWSVRCWRPVGRYLLLLFFVLIHAAWALRFGLQEWSG
jgi:hypothetical protein